MTKTPIFLSFALLGALGCAQAAERPIDPTRSSISAEFTQIGVPVEAPFKKFAGTIDYDPAKPLEAKARFEIDTASFDIGDEDYNAEVRKPEWFDSTKFPKASFTAAGLKAQSGSQFETIGKLALKGRTIELKVPLTVKTEGSVMVFSGTVPIPRKAFAIGGAGWDDTVEDTVKIRFKIVTP